MKNLRYHWRIVTMLVVIVVGTGAFFWHRAEAKMSFFLFAMQEGGTYTPLNAVQRDAIIGSLNEVALDRDALVALNLSTSQAETVVSTARTWQQNNQSTLSSQMTTIHQKRHAVREIEKAIAMGPFDANRETQLATARQELKDAQAAYRTTLTSLESTVNTGLSAAQQATWVAIKSGWGQQMPIRMLDLTDEQRLAVSDAHHRYQRQHSGASNDSERSTAVTTWTSALDSILTANQRTLMQSYNSNYANASAAAASAYATVLPLQEQVAGTP